MHISQYTFIIILINTKKNKKRHRDLKKTTMDIKETLKRIRN